MYKLSGVTKNYHKGRSTVAALRGVDLVIEDGEWLAVQGPTGHGKSTLLQAPDLADLEDADLDSELEDADLDSDLEDADLDSELADTDLDSELDSGPPDFGDPDSEPADTITFD